MDKINVRTVQIAICAVNASFAVPLHKPKEKTLLWRADAK
jgi:hypothetical protein